MIDEVYSYILDWANSAEYSRYSVEILVALQDFALNKKGKRESFFPVNETGVTLLVRNNIVSIIGIFLQRSDPELTPLLVTLIQNLSFSSHPRVSLSFLKCSPYSV